ncbi:MAG: adenosylmethionine--8-amino-7-oxononanoate transaminase [Candidatus Omnitrophica bacterium]|nr:adenosylmethionine--8-amino-7-oxononanoate transaminase [Candidatus Omnitrophota bacterium]
MTKTSSWVTKDRKYLWHPFTQMKDWQVEEVPVIERAAGCYLIDTRGRRYLDGVSSLWCNVHGHRVKALDTAIKAQLGRVAHSTFLGLTHPPGVELAEKLVRIAPRGLTRVFYSDSGSESVEIAVKMAYQYWQQRGRPKKKKFVKLTNAYHGDTVGSVSIGGIELFHKLYKPLLFETFTAPSPYRYRWPTGPDPVRVNRESLDVLEAVLKKNHKEIAAFVMEPLMQGAAGMIDQAEGYISRARQLTKKYNVLLIFDEVATGFGRTGKMFAANHEKVTPDLMAVAKGITGGYLPLAATLTTEEVYDAFLGEYDSFRTFFHGHTYTANPLACAAAIANLELFKSRQILRELKPKVDLLKKRLRDFYRLKNVGDVRQVGLMAGIELVRDTRTKTPFEPREKIGVRVIERARKKGAILRPLGAVIVLMPPLGMSQTELGRLLEITYEAIDETANERN